MHTTLRERVRFNGKHKTVPAAVLYRAKVERNAARFLLVRCHSSIAYVYHDGDLRGESRPVWLVIRRDMEFNESRTSSSDRCRYVNQFGRIDRIRHTLCPRPMRNVGVASRGMRMVGTRIGRYYERGIMVVCGDGARRTGLRGSIYSECMAYHRYTTIIMRSYWIIALHLAIPREQAYFQRYFPKRCISEIVKEALSHT